MIKKFYCLGLSSRISRRCTWPNDASGNIIQRIRCWRQRFNVERRQWGRSVKSDECDVIFSCCQWQSDQGHSWYHRRAWKERKVRSSRWIRTRKTFDALPEREKFETFCQCKPEHEVTGWPRTHFDAKVERGHARLDTSQADHNLVLAQVGSTWLSNNRCVLQDMSGFDWG